VDTVDAHGRTDVCHAPAAVAIETACVRWLGGRLGLPPGSVGQFTSGGSEANQRG
jgi:glutamate/tyrosine decarboxylase-like PLP-dependent enzyme